MNFISFLLIASLSLNSLDGTIIRVTDGDSFIFQTSSGTLRIRMHGIDAPEYDQDFGPEAKQFLIQYLHKKVKVFPTGVDKYGRTVGLLFVDSINVNLLEIREGLAWHYKKYSSNPAMALAEQLARQEKKGLWKNNSPLPPWEWRKQKPHNP